MDPAIPPENLSQSKTALNFKLKTKKKLITAYTYLKV